MYFMMKQMGVEANAVWKYQNLKYLIQEVKTVCLRVKGAGRDSNVIHFPLPR